MDMPSEITEAMVTALGWQTAFIVLLLLFIFAAIFGVIIAQINRRLQAEITELQEKLQAKLERGNYISKAKFDKEFEIYQNIWELVTKAEKQLINIPDLFKHLWMLEDGYELEIQTYGSKEAKGDLKGIIKNVEEAHNNLNGFYMMSTPFFDEMVYTEIGMFIEYSKGILEATAILKIYGAKISNSDFDHNMKKSAYFVDDLSKKKIDIANVIRNRLNEVEVI